MAATDGSEEFDVPPEHALLVVDMKGYSQVPEAKMAVVRSDLDDILATVFVQSGLPDPHSLGDAYKDTGDGAIVVLPARHTARLVAPLLGHLHEALARYDTIRLASAPPIWLRASVHVGPLTPPDHRGDAINEACRLVDSDGARQAMAAAVDNGSFLSAAVSEAAFRRTVRAGRTPDVSERQFLKTTARVNGKPGFEETCWLLVPGVVPAVISPYLADRNSEPAQKPHPPGAQAGGSKQATESQAGVRQKGKASGKARIVQVGGNYTTGPEQS
ncbi:hypothetical protein HEP86_39650 [Streptomyces sp. RPA4-5]|uniref:hypothetical protein n=1 Tax=Streptomyces sp. RPA4-5 TaxID=2721245 RepID=UPI00143E4970|nr:hypothetical protein [Streptomyces sp. RPA4-5]QIY59442.1 hypothetical protein HEP86_39650 [Streptomyces sp. RPA4-5]